MKVTNFKIDIWGALEISGWKNGRKVTHTYSNVPKALILKFLSCKSAPDMSDVDGWITAHEAKLAKNNDDHCISHDWWSEEK